MDYALEQLINGPAGSHPALDAVMKLIAGGAEAAFVALCVAWFAVGWARGQVADRRGAVTAVLAALVALGINQVLGHIWVRPRPFAAHASVHMLLSRSADSSFPSDHVAAAVAIAVVAVAGRRRLGVGLLLAAALVGYARVYGGAHYPGDVLGGALVGAAVALLLARPLAVVPQRLTAIGDEVLRRARVGPRRGEHSAA